MDEAMAEGDSELVRVDAGESTDDSRLEFRVIACDNDDKEAGTATPPASKLLGLSLPVGPLPRGGRLDGGRWRTCRK